jgi:hypothetical protein
MKLDGTVFGRDLGEAAGPKGYDRRRIQGVYLSLGLEPAPCARVPSCFQQRNFSLSKPVVLSAAENARRVLFGFQESGTQDTQASLDHIKDFRKMPAYDKIISE